MKAPSRSEDMNQFMLPPHRRSLCYHRIGVLVNPTCDGIRGSVGAGDRMGQRRQLQAVDGRYLIEPFEDAGADPRVKQAAGLHLSKQGDIPDAYWAPHPAMTQDAGLLK